MYLTRQSFTVFIAILLFTTPLHPQQSSISEETRAIKTYPFSDPDPVAILARRPNIYPYFAFDGYSSTGKEQQWQVVTLENDYIKVYVLPEVGGKVFGAIEKSTGNEFIYMNDALKFRRIALRGPWTSGGIEFNFGIIGHTPTTATPVDYLLRENQDGSVTCFVGAMDLASRTRWSVAITLPPDKAYFETRALWYNPTPFDQSYYSWITAALSARDDLHYFYPGHFVVPHSQDIANKPWPVDADGRDLSWYKHNDLGGSKSHFIFGEYENFFGGYWHEREFGSSHWALYDDMPGQKMWIWSLHRDGGIWEDLLTDGKGQYSEPQAGRLFSQVDHEFFQPYRGDAWREIWFPIKQIGGLTKATPEAAVNIVQRGDSLKIGVNALQKIDDDLLAQIGGNTLFRERLRLMPMAVYQDTVLLPDLAGDVQIKIGKQIYYTGDSTKNDVQRPIQYSPVGESTAHGLFLAGEFHEKQREYEKAIQKYRVCLQQDKNHIWAMARLALLHARRGEYAQGLNYAKQALGIQMYDPEANYAYGVLARRLGMLTDAKETLGWAARSMAHRSNAYCQLAEIHALESNYELACEYAQRALDFNKYNLNAYEILAISLRKQNKMQQAESLLNDLLKLDPLNHLARFELFLLSTTPKRLSAFKSMIRNELPHESYLEMAIRYTQLGQTGEAISLLTHSLSHPIAFIWLAYLHRSSDSLKSRVYLQKALAQSPKLVFPFREETIPVLQWAIEKQTDAWQPKYYLGLIYWHKGRTQEALRLFNECDQSHFAPFYLARAHLREQFTPEMVLPDLQQTVLADKNSWRGWHALIGHYGDTKQHDMALKLSREAHKKFPWQIVVTMDYAGALFRTGRFEDCLKVLENAQVLPYEGSWEAHDLYMRANIYLAMEKIRKKKYKDAVALLEKSKAYPEQLGSGEPYQPDVRLQSYLASLCFEKMGRQDWVAETQKGIFNYTLRNWTSWGDDHYFAVRTLLDMGEKEKANDLLQELQASRDPQTRWAVAKLAGEQSRAQQIEQKYGANPRFKMLVEVVALVEKMRGR
ncbi:MAG: DUF5107 domain-containing protein [bacterium]